MCNQLPCPGLAGTGQTDSISNAATIGACGDGGHRWDSLGISRTTAVCHGVPASLAGKLQVQAQSAFEKASCFKGIL